MGGEGEQERGEKGMGKRKGAGREGERGDRKGWEVEEGKGEGWEEERKEDGDEKGNGKKREVERGCR